VHVWRRSSRDVLWNQTQLRFLTAKQKSRAFESGAFNHSAISPRRGIMASPRAAGDDAHRASGASHAMTRVDRMGAKRTSATPAAARGTYSSGIPALRSPAYQYFSANRW